MQRLGVRGTLGGLRRGCLFNEVGFGMLSHVQLVWLDTRSFLARACF